ncbi:MAG: hypothetical protein HY695_02135 [Deltaproteobacteria bacterium]|nr:hypothetical protein [Deltaproteobacteria bacterium]
MTPNLSDRFIRHKYTVIAIFVLLLSLVSACANRANNVPVFVQPKYDFSLIKKIGVLPLENLSQDQQAGERVRKIVVSELLAAGILDVLEPMQVNRALAQQQVQSISSLSAAQIQELGKTLGVQAFVVGSVDTYERVNVAGGSFAEVSITLRALDAASGTVIWSTSNTAGGVSIVGRLFGFGGDTMYEATQKVVRASVSTLFR